MRWPVIALLLTTVGVVQAQVAYPPIAVGAAADLSGYATKADVASVQSLATSAKTSADTSVKKVGGTAPDGSGDVTLPSTFTGTTCVNCTMTNTAFSGTPTLNGSPVATASSVGAAIAALTFPVTSVNGLGGAVTVPTYTDAMAVAANAPSITSLTAAASAASRESVQVVAPASGSTVTASTGTTLLFVNNTALLAALTVTFPVSPVDGQRFTVAANNTITVLSFAGATGKGLLTTISANGFARYAYSSAVGAWLRTG